MFTNDKQRMIMIEHFRDQEKQKQKQSNNNKKD